MKVHHDIQALQPSSAGSVLTAGNFDGVHLGHRRIMETVCAEARRLDVPAVALTFEPHPLAIVAPARAPASLTTLSEKLALLERLGIDAVVVIASTRELLDERADAFLRRLTETCKPRVIVEGPTFNFGRGREGSIETLTAASTRYGYETIIVEEYVAAGLAQPVEVNSSRIRQAIAGGCVEDARIMLGRPYRITGVVGEGKHIGATIGFPTANLARILQLTPGHAVYAAVAQLEDGSFHLAAVNIGPQPTFGDEHARVEAYLLDYSGHLRGRKMGLHFLARLRDQVRFDCAEKLTIQLREDVEQIRRHAESPAALAAEALPLP